MIPTANGVDIANWRITPSLVAAAPAAIDPG